VGGAGCYACRVMRSACLVVLLLPCAVGCLPEEPPARSLAEGPLPPAEPVVVSAVTMAGSAADHARLTRNPSPPPPADADRIRPGPVFFRLGAGYGAVGRVDLTPCRERGLETGYVHMRVTFAGDGTVAHAAVESPTQPPPDALACIGERLEAAAVPAFEGGDVTLSKSVFVVTDGVSDGRPPEVFVKGGGPSSVPPAAVPPTASR
jgi:hypothetical protein